MANALVNTRIPPDLLSALQVAADEKGTSIQQEILSRLRESAGSNFRSDLEVALSTLVSLIASRAQDHLQLGFITLDIAKGNLPDAKITPAQYPPVTKAQYLALVRDAFTIVLNNLGAASIPPANPNEISPAMGIVWAFIVALGRNASPLDPPEVELFRKALKRFEIEPKTQPEPSEVKPKATRKPRG